MTRPVRPAGRPVDDDPLRDLRDRAEIADLVVRYARAVDAPDPAAAVACFAADGRFASADGSLDVRGREALDAFFTGALAGPDGAPPAPSVHLMGNVSVELAGDRATVEIDALVHRWSAAQAAVEVRSVRYHDEVVRERGGWRLAARRHRLVWQGTFRSDPFAGPGTAPVAAPTSRRP